MTPIYNFSYSLFFTDPTPTPNNLTYQSLLFPVDRTDPTNTDMLKSPVVIVFKTTLTTGDVNTSRVVPVDIRCRDPFLRTLSL